MQMSYTNGPQLSVIRVTSGFQRQDGQYFVPRAHVPVPEELLKAVFPKTFQWKKQFEDSNGRNADGLPDVAAVKFNDTLTWLAEVLIQDAVLLTKKYPDHFVFRDAIFHSTTFQNYAETFSSTSRDVQAMHTESVRSRIQEEALRAALTEAQAQIQSQRIEIRQLKDAFEQHAHGINVKLDLFMAHITSTTPSSSTRSPPRPAPQSAAQSAMTLPQSEASVIPVSVPSQASLSTGFTAIPPAPLRPSLFAAPCTPVRARPVELDRPSPSTPGRLRFRRWQNSSCWAPGKPFLSRRLTTVRDVWTEWFEGVEEDGGVDERKPAVVWMDSFEPGWTKDPSKPKSSTERKYRWRRSLVIDHVKMLAGNRATRFDTVISQLDSSDEPLPKLMKRLEKEHAKHVTEAMEE